MLISMATWMLEDENADKKRTASSAFKQTKGRRNRRPRLNDTAVQADVVKIRRSGYEVVIPASFFTKSGKLKKGARVRLMVLNLVPAEWVYEVMI
jgi:hypothetical protein